MEALSNIFCVIIPTYNNAGSIVSVVNSVLQYCTRVMVVCDGATDGTLELLEGLGDKIILVSYPVNRGKGYALSCGFKKALEQGFRYAVTMDSDGQHNPSDLPLFTNAIAQYPGSLIIGSRTFDNPNMPSGNTFANKFSNFWFTVQTGLKLPDTQTGFRLYPIALMGNMHLMTSRYEAELELLVRSAWDGIRIIPIPINVYYPKPEDRVSFFRPGKDFLRISLLNTLFCFVAIFYGYPSRLWHIIKPAVR